MSGSAGVSRVDTISLLRRFYQRFVKKEGAEQGFSSHERSGQPLPLARRLRNKDSPLDRQNSPPDCSVYRFTCSLTLAQKDVALVTSALSAADKLPCQSPCDGANPCSLYPPPAAVASVAFRLRHSDKKYAGTVVDGSGVFGPSDRSRTCGLLNPIQARYQSALHPEMLRKVFYHVSARNASPIFGFLRFYQFGLHS